jgi:23S rRNA (guanosine2251-2'-O)-methyltransferase
MKKAARKAVEKHEYRGSRKSDGFSRPRVPEDHGRQTPSADRRRSVAARAVPDKMPRPADDDLCWGRNPVLTLLRNRPELCRRVSLMAGVQDDFRDTISKLCAPHHIPLEFCDRAALDQMTGGAVHQGIAAKMLPLPPCDLDEIVERLDPSAPALIVLLDHCQDPRNLGAVIRTAEIAGAACVVCQNDRSARVNGTVVKTSAGAAFRLPVAQVVNVSRAIERLKKKNFWVIGLDHRTDETVWSTPLPDRLVLVVGSEGEGISPLTVKNCDKLVKFPMAGRTGNLNASVAAALGMFEWVRLYGCGRACAQPDITAKEN